jgi:hypothetical protein
MWMLKCEDLRFWIWRAFLFEFILHCTILVFFRLVHSMLLWTCAVFNFVWTGGWEPETDRGSSVREQGPQTLNLAVLLSVNGKLYVLRSSKVSGPCRQLKKKLALEFHVWWCTDAHLELSIRHPLMLTVSLCRFRCQIWASKWGSFTVDHTIIYHFVGKEPVWKDSTVEINCIPPEFTPVI